MADYIKLLRGDLNCVVHGVETCCREFPDSPEEWCKACISNAAADEIERLRTLVMRQQEAQGEVISQRDRLLAEIGDDVAVILRTREDERFMGTRTGNHLCAIAAKAAEVREEMKER